MINFLKKLNTAKLNRGMTYVELIVVLSIFATLSSVAIFNYGDFQARIDIRNLAGDIGLKIVEAQKAALSGTLPSLSQQAYLIPGWKPSYGVFFNLTQNNNYFIYFSDLDNSKAYSRNGCPNTECIDQITITKSNFIEKIESYVGSTPTLITILSITFSRPDSGASFDLNTIPLTGVDYIKITIKSPKGDTSFVKVYPSGRIEID